jgi:hypothetical protein
VVASIAFSSISIPIVLAAAIVDGLPPSTSVGTNPITLIAIYSIIFPILQWGIGGLLFPKEDESEDDKSDNANPAGIEDGVFDNAQETASSKESLRKKVSHVVLQFLQPPIIWALLGILTAVIPQVHGLFVNLTPNEPVTVPLGWLFNGLVSIAACYVPIMMLILGINLTLSVEQLKPLQSCKRKFEKSEDDKLSSEEASDEDTPMEPNEEDAKQMTVRTMIAVIFGKMVLLPAVGIMSVYGLSYIIVIPEDLKSSMLMVMILMFVSPTSNQLVVLVEISSGKQVKQALATLIACQYALAATMGDKRFVTERIVYILFSLQYILHSI